MKKIIIGTTFLLSLLVFILPSVLIQTMNLQNALVPNIFEGSLNYDFIWIPVTASIYMGKCICYITGLIIFYKGILLIKKQ